MVPFRNFRGAHNSYLEGRGTVIEIEATLVNGKGTEVLFTCVYHAFRLSSIDVAIFTITDGLVLHSC